MRDLGLLLMLSGGFMLVVGAAMFFGPAIGLGWLGKLPGDIRIERSGFNFYLPITTCLVFSLVLSLIFFVLSRWR